MRLGAQPPLVLFGLALALAANLAAYAVLIAPPARLPSKASSVAWSPPSFDAAGRAKQQPIEAYGQIAARPAFWRSRRPVDLSAPVPEPVAPAAAPPKEIRQPPKLTLSAVALSPDVKRALLTGPSRTQGEWSKPGDEVEGWKLIAIEADGVTLQADGLSHRIPLFSSPATATTAPPSRVPQKR